MSKLPIAIVTITSALLSLLHGSAATDSVVVTGSAPNCQWNGYDLSALANDQTYTANGVLFNGYVCGVVSSAGQCKTNNGALCAFNAGPPPVYTNTLARWDGSGEWSQIDPAQPGLGVQVTFNTGDTCGSGKYTTTFKFPCGTQASKPLIVASSGTCQYLVTYQTTASCTGGTVTEPGSGGGISGGSVFLIIFFVGGFLYVALGCVYKRQKMGAAGVESCPNIDFWRTLPGLVADGFRFTFTKLKALCSGNNSSGYTDVK